MSIILGLNANHADSSACLIKDGKLLFGIEEERINRIKHWAGFPEESIKYCLKYQNIRLSEITDICINTNPFSNISKKSFFFFKNYFFGKKKFEIINRLKKKISIKKKINEIFEDDKLNKKINFHYVDHHKSHIASSFFASKYKKSIGLSIDGFGDFCSIAIAHCDYNKIKIIKKIYYPNSLGLFYEAFTQLIGFKNYGDEYKMMGLSSYGSSKFEEKIKKVFNNTNTVELNLKFFNHTKDNFEYKFDGIPNQNTILSNKIFKLLNLSKKNINKHQIKTDIAFAVQKIYENILLDICKEISKDKFSKNLVLSGGCALNSLANKKLYDSNFFNNIFIPYAPGDAGGAIGAALYTSNIKFKKKIFNLQNPYIGTSYKNNEIELIIKKKIKDDQFKISFYNNKKKQLSYVAKKIFENSIVGVFNGKMEFGARALGNRSILANPCSSNIKEILNIKIKKRENFRPFAPAILKDHKKEWFNNDRSNPYMSAVEKINEDKKHLIPAVTHIDGTGRVQTIEKKINQNFYNLINIFYEISKVPIVLNTSFNENEPIVMNPEEAIDCFLRTKMDCLFIENYLIERF